MKFCIADSFQNGLRCLSAQEQKAVKETVFDLQMEKKEKRKKREGKGDATL